MLSRKEVRDAQNQQRERCERCLYREDAYGEDCKHRYVMGEQSMSWCMHYKQGTYTGKTFPKSAKKLKEQTLRSENIYFEEDDGS
jgi:methionine salvage enolase-phosphatase E1